MKHLYCLNNFTFYDRSGIARFLEEKAARGWMLEKTGSFFWRFGKTAARNIHFAVTYFPSASPFDAEPSDNQLLFREFCEHTGWHHLSDCGQMQIYFNENEAPVPIETDALIETENIHKSAKKSFLPGYFMTIIIGIMILFMETYTFADSPVEFLSDRTDLCMVMLGLGELVLGISESVTYYSWYRKAKKAAEETGDFIETHDRKIMRNIILIVMVLTLALMISSLLDDSQMFSFRAGRLIFMLLAETVLLFAATSAVSAIMKKFKASARANRRITYITTILLCQLMLVSTTAFIMKDAASGNYLRRAVDTYIHKGTVLNIYHDELPLYVEDLTETDYDRYSTKAEMHSTMFLSLTEAYQRPRVDASDEPSLEYTIVDVKLPFLFRMCLDDMIDDCNTVVFDKYGNSGIYEYVEVDPSPWNADQAYQLRGFSSRHYLHTYLLVYDNRIIRITPDSHPDDDAKAIIGEKLGVK